MNKQSREECMENRLYRYADKGEFRVISTGSCLLSGITGGTQHWFASPGLPITSSTCLPVTHCILLHHVRAVLHVLLVACTTNPRCQCHYCDIMFTSNADGQVR